MPRSVRPEVALLFLGTRQVFTSSHQKELLALAANTLDWPYIFSVAESHGIAPLFFANLQQAGLQTVGVPAEICAAFQAVTYRNIAVKAGVRAKLVEIAAFCAVRAVDVMLLKGAALDQLVYSQPWFTVHDVDLLLKPRASSPTTPEERPRRAEIDRFFWSLPGFEYEFNTHHDLTINGLLPVDFDEVWRDAQPLPVGGQQLWAMGPEDLLLAAAINACRKRYFHLKALLAMASILAHYPTLDWSRLAEKAIRYRAATILYTALLVTALTVGCALPATISRQLRVAPLKARCLRQLILWLLPSQWQPYHSPATHRRRRPNSALLLPYLAYEPSQLWRKTRIFSTARSSNVTDAGA